MATTTHSDVSHDEAVRLGRAAHGGSFISRLTTGTGAFDLIGRRRYYYLFSSFLLVASILLILLRGFHLGTDFAGGTTFSFVPSAGAAQVANADVVKVLDAAVGPGKVETVQTIGGKTIQATLQALPDPQQVTAGQAALAKAFTPAGGLRGVSSSDVSSSWGAQISNRAILAVIIFLIAVGLFIWIRYEKRVAIGAVLSTLHDVIVTAGIYSLAGFEVTPATVIGLLTILGFSLYDSVVVYDKVQENSRGLTSLLRRTYPETANLALNQTIMRSLNTSLIALLPVAGLLVAGVAVLGGGTLKDLALVLLVGMLVGAYSSIFVAVPIAVDLKMREPVIRAHTARVLAKRKADRLIVDADGDPIGRKTLDGAAEAPRTSARVPAPVLNGLKAGAPPKPGVKPQRASRQARVGGLPEHPAGSTRFVPAMTTGSTVDTASATTGSTVSTATGAAATTPTAASILDGAAAEPTDAGQDRDTLGDRLTRAETSTAPATGTGSAGAAPARARAGSSPLVPRPARSGGGKAARPTGKRNR